MKFPNVLLICTDHWGGDLLRCAGHPTVMTPTIDHMARNGIYYPNAYSPTPICIPARRSLMTGLSARSHGDRCFNQTLAMPEVPTLAQCFRDAGYQASAAGKLHGYPQRARMGFDEVILNEEGRRHLEGRGDDWEQFLADRGYAGKEYITGGNNNDYIVVPWHLPDDCHQTNWTAREMSRLIRRRDPGKPGFWYLSFAAPHPPLWPIRDYLEQYRDVPVGEPVFGDWSRDFDTLPFKIRSYHCGAAMRGAPRHEVALALRAFYALITHIDHQIRMVLGTLREEGLLENTLIAFTSDHGDMLGDHGLWGKGVMYERSVRIPLVIVPPASRDDLPKGVCDHRLAEIGDLMPTLLDLAGVPVPEHVEGLSLCSGKTRDYIYGEYEEGIRATRMIRSEHHKLIYYPEGNRFQLFDLKEDLRERVDLIHNEGMAEPLKCLKAELAQRLYGGDESWIQNGEWIGLPLSTKSAPKDFGYSGQRGARFL